MCRVAALIRSYFPELTAVQVKKILMQSVTVITEEVKIPGQSKTVPMSELSITGGTVNAFKAFNLAAKTKGKKKMVKPKA